MHIIILQNHRQAIEYQRYVECRIGGGLDFLLEATLLFGNLYRGG